MAVKNIQFTKLEIRIVSYLFKHYQDKFNPRQLAKLLGINHAHSICLCRSLEDKKLLVREELGNSIFFSYNYNHKLAIKFMEYLLSLEEKVFPNWLLEAAHLLKKFKNNIEMGMVFGSSIKTKDFKDIAVLLVYGEKKTAEIKRIKEEIRKSGLIEKPIRYIEMTPKDLVLNLNKKDRIVYSIMSENLIFHNPEKYVEGVRRCHR